MRANQTRYDGALEQMHIDFGYSILEIKVVSTALSPIRVPVWVEPVAHTLSALEFE